MIRYKSGGNWDNYLWLLIADANLERGWLIGN
jgi:hypothetical protein